MSCGSDCSLTISEGAVEQKEASSRGFDGTLSEDDGATIFLAAADRGALSSGVNEATFADPFLATANLVYRSTL